MIGTATDGPSMEPVAFTNPTDLGIFGAPRRESFVVGPTASSVVLDYVPFGGVNVYWNGRPDYLYGVSVSGTVLTFGSMGSSGLLEVLYQPYTGLSDLAASWTLASRLGAAASTSFVRLGGTRATLSVDGWRFASRYCGQKYNALTVTFTGSSLTFTQSGLSGLPTLTVAGTLDEILAKTRAHFDSGMIHVYVERVGNHTSSFSSNLTGGVDGTLSPEVLYRFLNDYGLPESCEMVLVLDALSSGYVAEVSRYTADYGAMPAVFMFVAPPYAPPASGWALQMMREIPYRLDNIVAVLGDAVDPDWLGPRTRPIAEYAAYNMVKRSADTLTNLPLSVPDFYPKLTEAEMSILKSAGFVVPTRHIMNDVCLKESVTILGEKDFPVVWAYAKIVRAAWSVCAPLLGRHIPEGPQPWLDVAIFTNIVQNTKFVRLESVNSVVVGDALYVSISALVYGELLNISMKINSKGSVVVQ